MQLIAEDRERIHRMLASSAEARLDDSAAERDAGDGDIDAAQPLEHEAIESAIVASLQERLAALDRAELRIADGTYGKSLADPAAELTVEEAGMHRHRHRPLPRRY
jgi:DnaK suppressor protein